VVGITTAPDRYAIGISGSKRDHCAPILESSGSPGTRQRLASDLVCAAGAMLVETLTLILSLWQKESRAFWSGTCNRPFTPESTSDGTAV
jgi:hypothetical protein